MQTFIAALVVSLLAIAGLAVGVLAGRPPIRGSCGGLACRKGIGCAGCAKAKRSARP